MKTVYNKYRVFYEECINIKLLLRHEIVYVALPRTFIQKKENRHFIVYLFSIIKDHLNSIENRYNYIPILRFQLFKSIFFYINYTYMYLYKNDNHMIVL